MYSRPQTKIPEVAVVAPSRDGNEEMYSRGGARSSEGARAASEANRRVAELEKQVEQLRARTERAEKKARVATGKAAASEANAAAAAAESSALFSGNWRDPRLTFQGRVLARSLNEKARKEIQRETRRAEVAERAAQRVVQRAKKSEAQALTKLARENELKKRAHERARDSEERLEAALKKAKTGGTVIKRSFALRRFRETGKLRVVKKLYERTKGELCRASPTSSTPPSRLWPRAEGTSCTTSASRAPWSSSPRT